MHPLMVEIPKHFFRLPMLVFLEPSPSVAFGRWSSDFSRVGQKKSRFKTFMWDLGGMGNIKFKFRLW